MQDALLFASGGWIGGGGGACSYTCDDAEIGDGGPGLRADGFSSIYLLDCEIVGGGGGVGYGGFGCDAPPGENGPPMDLGTDVTLDTLLLPARSWSVDNATYEGGEVALAYDGEPGDRVYIIRSTNAEFRLDPARGGVELVGRPQTAMPCLGTATTGQLELVLPIEQLTPPAPADSFLFQVFVIDGNGEFRWAGPGALTVLGHEHVDPLLGPVFVDGDAPPGGDGLSWRTAFDDLQVAIEYAEFSYENDFDVPREIWVAEGEYVAPRPGPESDGSFTVRFPTTIYGGFAGTERDPEERDLVAHRTVLTGDRQGDDGPAFSNRDDNAENVLALWGPLHGSAGRPVTIDGLTVRGGHGGLDGEGGGLYVNWWGDVAIRHSVIAENDAYDGGGVFLRESGSLYPVVVVNTAFVGNHGTTRGGGLSAHGRDLRLIGCRFIGNAAKQGGGVHALAQASHLTSVVGCEFVGNEGVWGGGAYLLSTDFTPEIQSCTFRENDGTKGAGGLHVKTPWISLRNSIFWDNATSGVVSEDSAVHVAPSGTPVAHYCCVEGWTGLWGGVGNHGLDPLFVNGGRLGPGSPCIDAGDNSVVPVDTFDLDGDGDTMEPLPADLDGNPRFVDDPFVIDTGFGRPPIVDMGAYERQGP